MSDPEASAGSPARAPGVLGNSLGVNSPRHRVQLFTEKKGPPGYWPFPMRQRAGFIRL